MVDPESEPEKSSKIATGEAMAELIHFRLMAAAGMIANHPLYITHFGNVGNDGYECMCDFTVVGTPKSEIDTVRIKISMRVNPGDKVSDAERERLGKDTLFFIAPSPGAQ